MGRPLRTRFDLLLPGVGKSVAAHTPTSSPEIRSFDVGDNVLAENFARGGQRWVPATVVGRRGRLMYDVRVGPGKQWSRHVDQLLADRSNNQHSDVVLETQVVEPTYQDPLINDRPTGLVPETVTTATNEADPHIPASPINVVPLAVASPVVASNARAGLDQESVGFSRYPKRVTKPPQRFNL